MEVNLNSQIDIVEKEKLSCCKANPPVKSAGAVILDSQDLHMLCKLAKSNNIEVILYNERKTEQYKYYIDKEMALNQYPDFFSLIEKEIEEYNESIQQFVGNEADSALFYFVAYGKYYIQEITFCNLSGSKFPTGEDKLQELLQKYSTEIEQIREQAEENKRKDKAERSLLLKEFEEYVRNDGRFVEVSSTGHRREYARQIFRISKEAERFRKLFYDEEDRQCENNFHAEKCYLELERIYQSMRQEREDYRKTKEYEQRLAAFEDFVQRDASFWQCSFPGHRRDYAYQVFRCNPEAVYFRDLFYFDSDVQCQLHDSRQDCFYELERIFHQGRKFETNNCTRNTTSFTNGIKRDESLKVSEENPIRDKEEERKRSSLLKEFEEYVRNDGRFVEVDSTGHRKDYARQIFRISKEAERFHTLFYNKEDRKCENQFHAEKCYLELERIYQSMRQEREDYRKTEEYARRLAAFEEFVQKDASFWQGDFEGHRRQYAYMVFQMNPEAVCFRNLFYFESDILCKQQESRMECFYVLERIYRRAGKKTVFKRLFSRLVEK